MAYIKVTAGCNFLPEDKSAPEVRVEAGTSLHVPDDTAAALIAMGAAETAVEKKAKKEAS